MIDLSCRDWEQRIRTGRSLMPDGVRAALDDARAAKAVRIFDRLRIPDIPGTPTLGEAGGDWFREIVRAMFGSFNGRERLIRELFCLVPKKNAKTTDSAALMLTATIMPSRPRAQYLLVGPTMEVASGAFDQAVGMIEADPELKRIYHIKDHIKKVINLVTGASLKIKSFDPKTATGSIPAGVLLDELHVMAEHAYADRVIGQLRGGLISQAEGFMAMITTQSERAPVGVFRRELLKARKVRDGALKLPLLPILYEFPDEIVRSDQELWRDPSLWHMVTPNLGRSVTIDRLEEGYADAVASGDGELRRWASQHLNLEIGLALRSDHWVGATYYPAASVRLTLEELIERCEIITIGIDGGGLDDMLALTVCGRLPAPEGQTPEWLTWSHAWIHAVAKERRPQLASTYEDFQRDGDLTIVEKVGDDMTGLGELVEQVISSGKFDKVGLDQAAIGGIVDELVLRGVPAESIIGVQQGWRLTSAIKTAERKLAEGKLKCAAQRLTTWAAGNARVEPKGNAILITKQASGSAKIDPLMSQFNAIELMSRNPAAKTYSMYFMGGRA